MSARRSLGKVLVLALAAPLGLIGATACGEGDTTSSEAEPRRVVSPRSEALRFFPSSTEAVALTEVLPADEMERLDEAMSDLLAWRRQKELLADALSQAGLEPADVLALARTPGNDIELPDPEIAAGPVPGAGRASDRMLYVVATDQGVALDRMFQHGADTGNLEPAGELHDARLYRLAGRDLAFGVRDGVLIGTVGFDRLQQAIVRRDGDRELQLDEAEVTELLNALPGDEPFHAYARPGSAATELLELVLGDLRGPEGDPVAPTELGLAAAPLDDGLMVDLVVELDGEPDPEGEGPAGTPEEPVVTSVTADDLRNAIAPAGPPGLLAGLQSLEPLAASAWLEGSRARVRFEASG